MRRAALLLAVAACACAGRSGRAPDDGAISPAPVAPAPPSLAPPAGDVGGDPAAGDGDAVGPTALPHVFVIAMENKTEALYGDTNATFINDVLLVNGARSDDYLDCTTATIPSEPHYIWLDAGTNDFADHTFLHDSDPSATNSTAETDHLVTKLDAAGKTWRSYQEGTDTGTCPVKSDAARFYAAKHDPFVFFQDVVGAVPSADAEPCASHHRDFVPADFAADLQDDDVAQYTFITPTLCHDMHGNALCDNGCHSGGSAACIAAGDAWLAENVPPIVDYLDAHGGVLFIVWDEPEGTGTSQPFIAIGPTVKPGYASSVAYSHSSTLKTLEEIFAVAVNDNVADAADFADLFVTAPF